MEAVTQRSGFFYGWVIVATASLGLLLGAFPISVASFGTFFPAYVADFHVRRSAISLALTVHNLAAALCTWSDASPTASEPRELFSRAPLRTIHLLLGHEGLETTARRIRNRA